MVAAWVTGADLPAGLPGGEADLDAAAALASAVLFGLSGRRWAGHGTRTIEILAAHRPWWWRDAALGMPWGYFDGGAAGTGWGLPALPVMYGGELFNETGGGHQTIRLPDFPVRAVTAVRLAGDTLDADTYRLMSNRFLEYRHSGGWPSCGLSGDRILEVDYTYGAEPPPAGIAAAVRLAAELAKAAAGQPNALPGYVLQRVRQGETIAYLHADLIYSKGRTGLADVDLWLATVNPAGLRRRSTYWSPDTDPRYRTTGGTPP